MTAGINPEVLRLSRAHGVSISAAHRIWLDSQDDPTSAASDYATGGECGTCDGTGLGLTEETRCWACKGTGQHFNFKHYYDEEIEP